MNYGSPGSDYDKAYYGNRTSNRGSPNKGQYYHDEAGDRGLASMNTALRNIHLNSTTVSEDETQINGILKGLKAKLADIEEQIVQREDEKAGVIEDINVLTQRLKALAKSISRKKGLYESYDKILNDSENALGKITESTKTLVHVVKKENGSLSKLNYSAKK
jgi:methyl-accepting chemotaxis protein